MVAIQWVADQPFHTVPYRLPRPGGGVATAEFPLFRATAYGLPESCHGLLVLSDLQGRTFPTLTACGAGRLLGESLAKELQTLGQLGMIPDPATLGVLIGGDLYVAEDLGKRGGKGDVRGVWLALRDVCRWVAGVPGNHDLFGSGGRPQPAFLAERGIHWLDPGFVEIDGLRIGGVGGIIGNPARPFRRDQAAFLGVIGAVAAKSPDILILHEGPSGDAPAQQGNDAVRDLLDRHAPMLVACGHNHWEGHHPGQLDNGAQILNADARGYLIEPDGFIRSGRSIA